MILDLLGGRLSHRHRKVTPLADRSSADISLFPHPMTEFCTKYFTEVAQYQECMQADDGTLVLGIMLGIVISFVSFTVINFIVR